MSSETPPTNPVAPSVPDSEAEASSEAFAAALQEFESAGGSSPAAAGTTTSLAVGMKVKGKVVSIGDEHALVDFGGRSEAVTETRHYRNDDGTLRIAPGDELDLFVVESADQIVLAPTVRPDASAALQQLRAAQKAGIPVTGRVTGINAGGLAVDLGGARGFCPVSQIESGFCSDASVYLGRSLEFMVTTVEDGRGGVVLSRRQLLRKAEQAGAKKMVAALKPGDELDATVARLEPFGAFVNLGGVDGLVHVSEISHTRIGHPKEALKVGEKVHVRVLRVESGKDGKPRIALSIRAAAPDPWAGIEQRFTAGQKVTGTVARLTDFGAFVTVAPGIDGLVHVSQAAPHRVAHVRDVLSPGQTIEAVVLAVEPEKKRLSLSVREAVAASLPPARLPAVGDVLEGRVGGVKPFGVFVDLPEFGPRVSGLLPREESGEPRGADLVQAFPMGKVVRVEVSEVKDGRVRVRLEGAPHVVRRESAPRAAAGTPRVAEPGAPAAGAEREGGASGRPGPGTREGGMSGRGGGGGGAWGGAGRPGAGGPRGEREGAQAARGPRREGQGREGRERGTRDRRPPREGSDMRESRGSSRETPTTWSSSRPSGEPEMTTMALALRAAMEKKKQKEEGQGE